MKKGTKTDMAVVYQAKTGAIALRGDFSHETVWASLDQIAALFGSEYHMEDRDHTQYRVLTELSYNESR